MNLKRQKNQALTLVELMIVVAILGVILSIALPAFNKTRLEARKKVCIENLSQIESAKQLWGVEKGKTTGNVAATSDLIGPTLYLKKQPDCPAGGVYDLGAIGTVATCTVEGHSLVGN